MLYVLVACRTRKGLRDGANRIYISYEGRDKGGEGKWFAGKNIPWLGKMIREVEGMKLFRS
jgi:hypothetical protein